MNVQVLVEIVYRCVYAAKFIPSAEAATVNNAKHSCRVVHKDGILWFVGLGRRMCIEVDTMGAPRVLAHPCALWFDINSAIYEYKWEGRLISSAIWWIQIAHPRGLMATYFKCHIWIQIAHPPGAAVKDHYFPGEQENTAWTCACVWPRLRVLPSIFVVAFECYSCIG